jgi:hypothetical protein
MGGEPLQGEAAGCTASQAEAQTGLHGYAACAAGGSQQDAPTRAGHRQVCTALVQRDEECCNDTNLRW